eukprot:CAMPEP_0119040186 /NCGR_PEP_ID=MMETSP1177-20130426/10034_1 /TAXON_ID=2985 /ORGANISM="Ochromonas sp, Strain CCMP1899" /LENGTH=898 /DNA_ID=CAMNT_0007004979 /DNA_START=353 /DNA_END=3049 /DNA_ORIENTATION=+
MVLGQLLYLNLKTDEEMNCTVPQKAQQSIWLNNLPVRWFDLDIGGSEISKTHMLWAYLEEQFGNVKYMETSGQNTEKASLQMNVCVQFSSQNSSEKIVELLGGGKCVCRREGSPTIFHLSIEYDTTGYFTDYQRSERAISRQKLHAAKKTESICISESMIVLEKAGKFLERDDIVNGRTQSDSVEEGGSKLEKACLNVRFMMKQGASSMEKSTDIKQFCTNLKVACNVISDNILRLEKILITENILKEEAMRKEAERKVQVELTELQSKAKKVLSHASDILNVGKQACDQNNWIDISDKLFNRHNGLVLTLSQLVKKSTGGIRYTEILQKSVILLEGSMNDLFPLVELLSAFSALVLFLFDIERDILALDCPSSGDSRSFPGTCDARDALDRLMMSSRNQLEAFLTRIRSDNPEPIESLFTEEDILTFTDSIDALMKLARDLKDTEMLAHSVRNYPINFSKEIDSVEELDPYQLKLNTDLECIHKSFISDTIDSFDYRISRISVLLRSDIDSLKEPSFLRGLRNSIESCCTLLHTGVDEFENKKKDLIRVEKNRVQGIETSRLAEIERIRFEKESKRRLLEDKIAALKSRKEELEAEEAGKKRKAIDDEYNGDDHDLDYNHQRVDSNSSSKRGNYDDDRENYEYRSNDYQNITRAGRSERSSSRSEEASRRSESAYNSSIGHLRRECEYEGFTCTLQRPIWDEREDDVHIPLDDIMDDSNNDKDDSATSRGDGSKKETNIRRLSSVVGYKAAPMNSRAVLSTMRRGGIDVKGGRNSSRQIEREVHDVPTSRSVILMDDVHDDTYQAEDGVSDDDNSEEHGEIYMDVNNEDEGVNLDINNDNEDINNDDEDRDDENIAVDDDDAAAAGQLETQRQQESLMREALLANKLNKLKKKIAPK